MTVRSETCFNDQRLLTVCLSLQENVVGGRFEVLHFNRQNSQVSGIIQPCTWYVCSLNHGKVKHVFSVVIFTTFSSRSVCFISGCHCCHVSWLTSIIMDRGKICPEEFVKTFKGVRDMLNSQGTVFSSWGLLYQCVQTHCPKPVAYHFISIIASCVAFNSCNRICDNAESSLSTIFCTSLAAINLMTVDNSHVNLSNTCCQIRLFYNLPEASNKMRK